MTWWKKGPIYQIYIRSFSDSNSDGIGDIKGIASKLDYLHDLGVEAIWITPFFPSPMIDFGYDVIDYKNVDSMFGTLKEFDKLINRAHKKGIKIIIDLVLNHTSIEHPWFKESRSSLNNPKRDWYIWKPAGKDSQPPNNWRAFFGGASWTLDPQTNEYYLHSFLNEQPDVNWQNPEVQEEMMSVLRFWLERGVDGFRLDALPNYFEDPELRDNPTLKHPESALNTQLRVHNFDLAQTHEVIKKMRELCDSYNDERILIGEVGIDGTDPYIWSKYYGEKLDELHLSFNFSYFYASWDINSFRTIIQDWETKLPQGAWPSIVMSSHDQTRSISRYQTHNGDETLQKAHILAVIQLTLRGTPFIYYGEEVGLFEHQDILYEDIRDPKGIRNWPIERGRDGCRTPMPWNGSIYGGFSTVKPWLPLEPHFPMRNVEQLKQSSYSIFNLYRNLIKLRKEYPALMLGDFEWISLENNSILSFKRTLEDQIITVCVNIHNNETRCTFDPSLIIFNTHNRQVKNVLLPYQAIILTQ